MRKALLLLALFCAPIVALHAQTPTPPEDLANSPTNIIYAFRAGKTILVTDESGNTGTITAAERMAGNFHAEFTINGTAYILEEGLRGSLKAGYLYTGKVEVGKGEEWHDSDAANPRLQPRSVSGKTFTFKVGGALPVPTGGGGTILMEDIIMN